MNNELKQGVYRHYKGGFYQTLALAGSSDDETDGQLMVVYVCLYTSKGGPFVRVRSLESWNEVIPWQGAMVSRFVYVGDGTDGEDPTRTAHYPITPHQKT